MHGIKLQQVGDIIQKPRFSLFRHIARMDPRTPAHAFKLVRDISMGRRIPYHWRRPRGLPHLSWCRQIKQDIQLPLATAWIRVSDRWLWRLGARTTKGYTFY